MFFAFLKELRNQIKECQETEAEESRMPLREEFARTVSESIHNPPFSLSVAGFHNLHSFKLSPKSAKVDSLGFQGYKSQTETEP